MGLTTATFPELLIIDRRKTHYVHKRHILFTRQSGNPVKAFVRSRRFCVLAALLVQFTAQPSVSAGPVWEKPSLSLGSLDLDGGLSQRFQLGTLSGGSPEFSFPVILEHTLVAEEAVSEYRIPQLETYVVPEGREQILWLEPGGIRHVFKTKDILATAPEKQEEPWGQYLP